MQQTYDEYADLVAGGIRNLTRPGKATEIHLFGDIPSKKNRYSPTKGGMHKGKELKEELDALEEQIPGDMRDLCLQHPDIVVEFAVKNRRKDRDGMLATLLDVLVACKVITDDSINSCNGTVLILPAKLIETHMSDYARIWVYPR